MLVKSKLSLFPFTMIVIGLVIGMGIFRTAATSAEKAISPSVYFSAWIIGGLVALCGALTYAEIGSRYPVTGGYYKVFAKAYHPSIAFSINCLILVSNAASISAVSLVGSGYLLKLFDGEWTDIHKAILSTLAILVFYFINMRGIHMSARVQTVLMLIKIGMLLLLVAGLFFPDKHAVQQAISQLDTETNWNEWTKSLGISLIAVSFTYGGYQQTINLGNDVHAPQRNIPRGIFMGIMVVIILYLLVNLSYYYTVGFQQMKNEKEIAYAAINNIFGERTASVFSALLFLGVFAFVNGELMSNPRVLFAMGEDRSLPKIFAKENTVNGVQPVALTVFAFTCIIILFFSQEFEKILTFSIFIDSFGMILSSASIFWFRKKTKHLDGTGIYKMKWFPLMPLVFILAYLFVGFSIIRDDWRAALTGAGLMILFTLIYFFIRITKQKNQLQENESL